MTPAQRGCQLFCEGRYFEAHEEWEAAWNDRRASGRDAEARELQAGVLFCGVLVLLAKDRVRGAAALLCRLDRSLDDLFQARVLRWDRPAQLSQQLAWARQELERQVNSASPFGEAPHVLARLSTFRVAFVG